MQTVYSRSLFCFALCVVATISMVACSNASEKMEPLKAISETNQERERLGLRTIKPSWYLYRTEFGAEDWKLSQSSQQLAKRVQYDAERKGIQWEEDYYYSGRAYTDADGTGWEHAVVHYDYLTGIYKLHYLGTNATLHGLAKPFNTGTTNRAAIMNAADMILNSLGQQRL